MKKILLLDSSSLTLSLLRNLLMDQFECQVDCYSTISSVVKNDLRNYDLLIMDHSLVDQNSSFDQIASIFESVPTIIFSLKNKLKDAVQMVRWGAIDYIDKTGDNFLDELLNSIVNLFKFNHLNHQLVHTESRLSINKKLTKRLFLFCIFLISLLCLS